MVSNHRINDISVLPTALLKRSGEIVPISGKRDLGHCTLCHAQCATAHCSGRMTVVTFDYVVTAGHGPESSNCDEMDDTPNSTSQSERRDFPPKEP